eukprot:1193337-Prorocentrum_minimum.AAC.2
MTPRYARVLATDSLVVDAVARKSEGVSSRKGIRRRNDNLCSVGLYAAGGGGGDADAKKKKKWRPTKKVEEDEANQGPQYR